MNHHEALRTQWDQSAWFCSFMRVQVICQEMIFMMGCTTQAMWGLEGVNGINV